MRESTVKWLCSSSAAVVMFAASALVLAQSGSDQTDKYQEGVHYFKIEQGSAAPTAKPEVAEAFSYLCSHCNAFEPYISNWVSHKPDNVKFRRIPVEFGRSTWALYARAYVTADLLNVADKAHSAMMDRLWKEKKVMRSIEELADFYSQFGADPKKFVATSKSFGVDRIIREDQEKVRDYGVEGTPTLIVDGKYRVQGSAAVPNYDVMLDVVNFLINRDMKSTESQQGSDSGG